MDVNGCTSLCVVDMNVCISVCVCICSIVTVSCSKCLVFLLPKKHCRLEQHHSVDAVGLQDRSWLVLQLQLPGGGGMLPNAVPIQCV